MVVILTTPTSIQYARLLALKGALNLELKGMSRRGRSAYVIIKADLGFKGSRQSVYDQLCEYLEGEGKCQK